MSLDTPTFLEWLAMFDDVTGFDWRWAVGWIVVIAVILRAYRTKR